MFTQYRGWGKGFAVGMTVVLILAGCSKSGSLHPSYSELVREGFYVYVLPKDEVAQRGWEQEVTIWSFDRHCKALTAAEQYNPLQVSYTDPYVDPPREDLPNQSSFAIQIGPWVPPWASSSGPWAEVELQLEHMDGKTAQYKEWSRPAGVFLGITFVDVFGQPVCVSSWLPLEETVSLINQLEYVGPPPDTVADPWDCSRHLSNQ